MNPTGASNNTQDGSLNNHFSLIQKSTSLRKKEVLHKIIQKELNLPLLYLIFGISFLFVMAAAYFVYADEDTILIVTIAVLGWLVAIPGHVSIRRARKQVETFRLVTLAPFAIYALCLLIAGSALAAGRSDYFANGPLRSRLRPEKKARVLVIHDFSEPVTLGNIQIKFISASLSDQGKRGRALKMVLRVTNITPDTKINLSQVTKSVLLKDQSNNLYAKLGEDPLKVESKQQNDSYGSFYPGDRIIWTFLFEPPIEQAESLDLTIYMAHFTSSQGLVFRIPKATWLSPENE